MLQLKDIDQTKLNPPVLDLLKALELKHAKLPYYLVVTAVQDSHKEMYWQLRFHDARFNEGEVDLAGTVSYTYGKRSDHEYKVSSRKIQNDRFGHWSNEQSSQRTKDLKKAVKLVVNTVLPFEWYEISNKGRRTAEQEHQRWANADSSATNAFSVDIGHVYEEVKHLASIGVQFKTEAFKNAAAGIGAYEEFKRKIAVKPKFDTVIYRGEKAVYIPDGRALEPQELLSEALPENTRNAIALLKLVGENSLLPEVGFKSGENTYFVYV